MATYGIIYKITNRVNGKIYVGHTIQGLEKRWKQHIYQAKNRFLPICNAIKYYGPENFSIETLYECATKEELDEQEKIFSEKLNAMIPYGYTCRVGSGPGTISEETRRKLSESKKGEKNPQFGCRGKDSPLFGIARSEESKRKNAEAHTGEKHVGFGKHLSEETRKKISAANRGKVRSEEARAKLSEALSKTYRLISPKGEEVSINGLIRFCKENGLNRSSMFKVAAGNQEHHQGWRKAV